YTLITTTSSHCHLPTQHISLISLTKPLYFFFNNTTTTEIYTLSLHDALPIYNVDDVALGVCKTGAEEAGVTEVRTSFFGTCFTRSEERFSRNAETDLVCRLLLEKKKRRNNRGTYKYIIR